MRLSLIFGLTVLLWGIDCSIPETRIKEYRVLVFSLTKGYRHSSIEAGIKAIRELGDRNGFEVVSSENPDMFHPDTLSRFRVVVFLNTSDNVLDRRHQKAFKSFIRSGGGWVGVHGASATEYDWEYYEGLAGTLFEQHPKIQKATIQIVDRIHPSTVHLPAQWELTDEWYNWRKPLPDSIHVLANLLESTYEGGTNGEWHPIAWCHEYDGGRAWFTGIGHPDTVYSDPLFTRHLLGGIQYAAGKIPKVFLNDPALMQQLKFSGKLPFKPKDPASKKLIKEAEKALSSGPFSVTYKSSTPPSGDKHDYLSMGPYWWPNPDKPDGPYIRIDGETNPERDKYDKPALSELSSSVETLALAYHMTGREDFAAHAVKLIKAWFLDEETRMNPHLEYGQFIPGVTKGRAAGIIDTRSFLPIGESVNLLAGSDAEKELDRNALKNWFSEYLNWMLTSKIGRDEADQENNHGTWYDVQTAYLALWTGNETLAREIMQSFGNRRIKSHVEPDGSQPLELRRTRSLSYSMMNLRGYFQAALLGEQLGVDLWHYESEGRSMEKALDFLVPFVAGEKKWTHKQIREESGIEEEMRVFLQLAVKRYPDAGYEGMLKKLKEPDNESRMHLLYPDV